MHPILQALRATNTQIIANLEARFEEARARRDELRRTRKPEKLTFEVALVSLWKDTGPNQDKPEEDVTLCKSGSLQELIQEAETEFKRINSRKDVQATRSVHIVFRNGTKLPLPEELWKSFCGKH